MDIPQVPDSSKLFYVVCQFNVILKSTDGQQLPNYSSDPELHKWKRKYAYAVYDNILNKKLNTQFVLFYSDRNNVMTFVFEMYNVSSALHIINSAIDIKVDIKYYGDRFRIYAEPFKINGNTIQSQTLSEDPLVKFSDETFFNYSYAEYMEDPSTFGQVFAMFNGAADILSRKILTVKQLFDFAVTFINDKAQWEKLAKAVRGRNDDNVDDVKNSITSLSSNYADNKYGADFAGHFKNLLQFIKYIIIYLGTIGTDLDTCDKQWYTRGECIMMLKAKQLEDIFEHAHTGLAKQLIRYFVQKCDANNKCGNKVYKDIIVPFAQATHFPVRKVNL